MNDLNDLQQRLASLSPAQRALLEKKLAEVGKPLPQTTSVQPKQRTDRPSVLSFAQQRLWFLDQLLSGNSPYNVPMAVRLSGLLDVRCLERSLNAVIERHEVLRTTIGSIEGKPFQIVQEDHLLELVVHDLSMRPEADKEPETSRVLVEAAQRPFDLAQDLMLRAMLIKLSEQEYILLLVMHHIASDGWSMGILMRELSHFYEAEMSGLPGSLPELPIQYPDYAKWQLEWLQGEALNKQLDYWKQQLAGAPTSLDLPTDRPRPAIQTFRGSSRQLELSPELTQSLKALSLRERCSLFMTLLAAFQVLLFRYTRQDDIVVGSPIAGRNRGEVEGLIGFFVNTLVLRTDLSGNPTFVELLRRVREVALNAYDHQDLPFERLVEELQSERSLSRNPLFQVMFVLQNAPGSPLELSGLQASPVRLVTERAHFDLTMSITERRPGMIARLSYSTDLFEDPTIERMLGHFRVLLEGAVAHPEGRLSELPLLTREEWAQLMQWNGTRLEYPPERCLSELFEAQVERLPEAVAVVHQGQPLTYRELNRQANQLGHYLKKRGVGPEVLVGICMDRSVEMIVGLLGILKAGGAYVPLDPTYPPERLDFMLKDARAGVVVTTAELLRRLPELDAQAVCLDTESDAISQESDINLAREGTAENLAYVIYTSGSTGRPKGAPITHQNVVRLFLATDEWFGFNERDIWTLFHSYAFDFSVWELWGALIYGGRLVVVPYLVSRNPKAFYELLVREQVTVLNQTPSAFRQLIEAENVVGQKDLALRYIIFGGEALEMQSLRLWYERHGDSQPQLVNMYGITETTVHVTYRPLRQQDLTSGSIIGRPIPDLQVYLLNDGQVVPVGIPGEMFVGGAGLGRGYLNRPDLTAERFIPNPFGQTEGDRLYRTGDLARYLPDGTIEFLGRVDNQVKIRGFRIELGEIEAALCRHASVEQAVLICREDTDEKRLVAYFTVNRAETSIAELRNFLKSQVPEYMVPAVFVRLDKLPLTANGKVDRRALPEPVGSDNLERYDYCPPRDRLELQLAKVWESVLEVERVGVKDNFFDLGGHSLLATRLIARIEKTLGKRVSLASLFQSPTIEGIAQELQEGERTKHPSSMPSQIEGSTQREEPLIQPRQRADQPVGLSFAQQRLWFLDQLLSGSAVYNIPSAFRFSGFLDARCLEQSLNAVIRRHKVLRTTIESVEGKPVQIVAEKAPFELLVQDLSLRPEAERAPEASKILAHEAQRPFNLARDLMLRATLIRLDSEEHILLVVLHHIASDGWSMGILMRELSHFYEAEITGSASTLPELPIQYADYAKWQREWLQGKVLDEQLDYWKRQLAGVPSGLDLLTDRPRPAVQTFRGASRQIELSPRLTQSLKALSLQERASLFMTLLAAFQVLLFRWTAQDDIVLGSPIAGRNRGEVEDLIGFFVNTLALRTDLSGNPTFLDLLHRVREVALEAYDHQDLPFERLVEDLQAERSLSHNPLFQVMFVLQNAPGSPLKLPGIQVNRVRLVTESAHFDLTMSITERPPGLIARLSYSTDLFEDATIERMLGHFEVLLDGIVKQPRKRISDLPILKDSEEKQFEEWNQTRIECSQDWDLAALFESQVGRTPEAVAVEFEGEALSYADLNCRANQLAHSLRTMGVGPDVLVGLYMERSLETMVAVLGVLKAGGAYVPMDTAYPGDRLAFMLTDAHPRVVITQQRLRNTIPDHNWSVICLDSESGSISKESTENLAHEALPDSLAYVIYTSGSTGRPKGVAMTRRALVNLVIWQCGLSNSKESSRTLQFTSLSFDVSFQEIFSTWSSGGSLVLVNEDVRRDSLALLQFLQEKRINRLFLPFIALEHLAEAAASCDALPSALQEVYTAGEQLMITPHIRGLFEKLPGCSLHNHYGPSESHVVTAYPLPVLTIGWEPRPPIGGPIANCQVYILDRHLTPVPVGVAGELFIGGDCLARGYLDRPDFTAEKFLPNPFCRDGTSRLYKTGDLVRYRADGRIEFLGRADRQVKLRGFRIELGEIESVLAQHSGVREAVVVVREDVPGDQRLVAYVVRQGEGSCDADELRSFLSKSLPAHMLPSVCEFLEALPLTPSGKVDRKALPAVSGESWASKGYLGPRDEIETALVGIWEELLKTRPVGVRDSFFELGGHSLLATRLIARIERILGAKVSLASLFQTPTIESLAENLQKGELSKLASLMPLPIEDSKQLHVPAIRPQRKADQPLPLSFAQRRLWFIDRLLPGSSLYNVPMAVRLRGPLDIKCLRRSLEAVVRRHEVLRTTIADINGEPFQVVAHDWSLGLAVRDLTTQPALLRETAASDLLADEAFHPFDLARDLMLRAVLLKLTEEEHVLLLVMHHIASDGWSLSVLMRELSHYYQSYLIGKEGSLEELPIQYADYAIWQSAWLQGEVLEKQLGYWKQNLENAPRVLELPVDRPRSAIQTFQGASQRMQLPQQLVEDLNLLCRRENATLFMTLLAAFQLLLSRYAGRDDIIVGSPIAGRNRQEAEDLIGFFVNTLVLRTDLSGDPTFLELLGRVRQVALGAYSHQDVPFERLVDELQAERDLSHHPLVQVMLVLQNGPQEKLVLSGLDVSPFRIRSSQAKFDLTLSVAETESGMTVALGYNTSLFATAGMERMLAHFRLLLESINSHPEHRLSELPMLTGEEWALQRQWNDTGREYPRERGLAELFEAQAEGRWKAVALGCEDRQLTYGELNRRANQLGHYLRKRGVGPEVRVGICMNRSVEMVVGLLGILKAGAAYVTLDRAYPGERLNYLIQDAGITVLLTEQGLLKNNLDWKIGNRLKVICLDRDWGLVSRESEANLRHLGTGETLAYLMYTSGSTGQPKGVGIPQRAVSRLVLETNYARFGEDEVFLQMAPTSFDASTFELWGALLNGSRCVLYPGGLPNLKTLGQQIERHGVTTLWLTASLFNTVIDDAPEILRPIRQLLIGGEALSVTHVRQAKQQLPNTQIINGYGPTENTTFTCCHTIAEVVDSSRSIPIGTPITNTQVYLLDRYLNPVPVGVVGELYAGGEGLARGYWGRVDLTAERFIPNPFGQTEGERLYRTGDLARYLPDGSIEFIGRTDNQVKIRGFRIEFREIEAALCRHSLVEQAVVTCREDRGEKQLVAYFTVNRAGTSIPELRNFLKSQVPDYMVPAAFIRLEQLPLTANGKIDRRALPSPLVSDGPQENGFCPPRDRLELQLTKIWESLLQVERVSVKDNFFDLGGHSLLAVKLLAHINQSLGRNLSVVSVFQAPTVEQMAELLRQQGWRSPGECLVVVQPNGSKPPFFCVHGYAGYAGLAAHLGQDQPVYGLVQGLDGNRFYTQVEGLAAHYLKDVRSLCPKGPYFLGGHSFGGLVAFEMAQQLRKAGEEVGLLALIDPTPPRHGDQEFRSVVRSSKRRWRTINNGSSRIRGHLGQLLKLPWERRGPYIRERFRLTLMLLLKNSKRLTCEMYLRLRRPMPPELRTFYIGEILFGDHYPAASRAYRSHRYDGPAVLIHTGSKDAFNPEVTWRELIAGRLTTHTVPGKHLEILKNPLIGAVAGHLRNYLQAP